MISGVKSFAAVLFTFLTTAALAQTQTLNTSWSCSPATSGANSVLTCTATPIVIQWPAAQNLVASASNDSIAATLTLSPASTSSFTCTAASSPGTSADAFNLTATCLNAPLGAPNFTWTTVNNASPSNFIGSLTTGGGPVSVPPQPNVVIYALDVCIGAAPCAPRTTVVLANRSAPTGCGLSSSSLQAAAGASITLNSGCTPSSVATDATTRWTSSNGVPITALTRSVTVTPFPSGSTSTSVTYTAETCNGLAACTPAQVTVTRAAAPPPVSGSIDSTACGNVTTYEWPARQRAFVYTAFMSAGSQHVIYVNVPSGSGIGFSTASDFTATQITTSKTFACRHDSTSVGVSLDLIPGNSAYFEHSTTPVPVSPYSSFRVDTNRWAVSVRAINSGTVSIRFVVQ